MPELNQLVKYDEICPDLMELYYESTLTWDEFYRDYIMPYVHVMGENSE